MKLYEAMFLADSSRAAGDWDGLLSEIRNILERAGTEILSMKKWDERQLAYKVKGHNRGTYILSYFRAESSKIAGIERDVKLSEPIMRVLILSAEGREQDIDKDTPATIEQKQQQAEASKQQEQPVVGVPAEFKQETEATQQLSAQTQEQPVLQPQTQQNFQAQSEQEEEDSEKQIEADNESESEIQPENEQNRSTE